MKIFQGCGIATCCIVCAQPRAVFRVQSSNQRRKVCEIPRQEVSPSMMASFENNSLKNFHNKVKNYFTIA